MDFKACTVLNLHGLNIGVEGTYVIANALMYGNFDVISRPFLTCFSARYRPTRAVCCALSSLPASCLVLIGCVLLRAPCCRSVLAIRWATL